MTTDNAWAGRRCRAVRDILTIEGCIPQDTDGTLRYVLPLPGRFLVMAKWDNGMAASVPSSEVVIFPAQQAPQAVPQVVTRVEQPGYAPSRLVWYLALTLCLFALGWAYMGSSATLQLFATIYLSCTGIILLLYEIEELFAERTRLRDQAESAASHDRSA